MGSMKHLLILSVVFIAAQAKPAPESYAEGYGYHPEYQNYYVSPVIAAALPVPQSSQHHSQDELGQYEYGFNTGNIAKHELKTADGVTRGSYSYVDANGILQTTNYISDDVFGFRVAATNLPQHVVPAAAAPVAPVHVAHVQPVVQVVPVHSVEAVAEVKAAVLPAAPVTVFSAPAPQVYAPTVAYSYLPYATQYGYNSQLPSVLAPYAAAPLPVAQAPVHVATPNIVPAPAPSVQNIVLTPAVPTTHQFHTQDELGQYQFGYTEPKSSRIETKTADGVVTGRYNYIDSNGIVQTVEYIADALGFRVAGTNIPQHHVAAPVAVSHTPEVIAAREAHLELVREAKAVVAPVVAPVVAVVAEKKEILQPYVPPPVATFYKAADPVKVAAAVEKQLVAEQQHVVASVPIAQLTYTVGHAAPVAAAPFVAHSALPVVVGPIVQQPQIYVSQTPVAAPLPVVAPQVFVPPYIGANQHHAQDEYGQYQYGYTNEDSSKLEQRLADGSVRGTYSYVDANGIVQRVDYISDQLGFRVAATNLPVAATAPVAPVAPVPVAHAIVPAPATKVVSGFVVPTYSERLAVQGYQPAVVQPLLQQVPAAQVLPAPVSTPIVHVTPHVAPLPYYINPSPMAVPIAANVPYASQYGYQQIVPIPSVATTSQHHAQNELGEYNYGYSNPNSAKNEIKTADGVTRGSYSYVDANNVVQRVDYIADDLYGFRVAATNLPVAPVAAAPISVPVSAVLIEE